MKSTEVVPPPSWKKESPNYCHLLNSIQSKFSEQQGNNTTKLYNSQACKKQKTSYYTWWSFKNMIQGRAIALIMLQVVDYGMPRWLGNDQFWPSKKVLTNNLTKKTLHRPMTILGTLLFGESRNSNQIQCQSVYFKDTCTKTQAQLGNRPQEGHTGRIGSSS